MTPKIWSYGDVGEEDVPVRDRPYEHFGSQGYAMPDHAAGGERTRRGAVGVELGEPVADAPPPNSGDERIRHEIAGRLVDDGSFDAGDIEVVVHGGEVALTGSVADDGDRERAVHIAETVRGVVEVVPRIRIR
jgi:hypothetical protein